MTAETLTIDQLAIHYSLAVESRRALQSAIRRAVVGLAEQYAPDLRAATADEADAHAALIAAVEQHPQLFVKPRTRTVGGVRFGWQKGKPRIEVPDEPETIRRIKTKLPPEQVELLIRIKESLHKPSVLDLTAADLRRLGIVQLAGADTPFARPAADAADKLVDLLLDEATHAREDAA